VVDTFEATSISVSWDYWSLIQYGESKNRYSDAF